MTLLFAATIIGLALTILAFARQVATEKAATRAALHEAEDARAALTDHRRQNARAAAHYDHALNTLRGQVAEREQFALDLACQFDAAWTAAQTQHADELAARRAAPRKKAAKKAVKSS